MVHGKPKDITLLEDEVVIECKHFGFPTTGIAALQTFAETGYLRPISGPAPPGFNRTFLRLGSDGSSFQVTVNDWQRFTSGAFYDKLRQLVPGRCNLIAFNASGVTSGPGEIDIYLRRLLDDDSDSVSHLSGFLVTRQWSPSLHTELGSYLSLRLVERSRLTMHPVPEGVRRAVALWNGTHRQFVG